ncbi:MAG: hypothetical protein IJA53_02860 [Spirochaetaceae bacterium]|nr:hypothetical protein [Spirochaetaceae bacterium]
MKKILKNLFSILILLCVLSCSSTNTKVDFTDFSENEIPFSYGFNGYMPLFTFYTESSEDKIVKLELEFDSGLDVNFLSKRGIKKMFPKTKFSESGTYTIKQVSLETENEVSIENAQFKYRKDEFKASYQGIDYDGAIGLSFFKNFGKVTFDFRNQKVILGEYQIDSMPIKMVEVNILDNIFYEIPIYINGNPDTAIIDFGTKGFAVIRENFGRAKHDFKDEDYLKSFDKSLLEWNSYINIESLQVGNFVLENVKCQNSKGRLMNIPDIVRNVIFYNNTIGIELFKDKIVQFDFENNLFYVK